MSNPFEVLAWIAVVLLVVGWICYECGYRDGTSDTRIAQSKPARRIAQR